MPDFFRLISEYFWAIALVFSVFNYWKADQAAMKAVAPTKVLEAKNYLRNFAAAGSIPWVIMGIGQVTGETPTVWHYFRPQDENFFVLAWLAAVFVLSGAFAWWVFLANGAQKVVEYNLLAAVGQGVSKSPSERMVKLFAALGLITFPIWVYGAIYMNTPIPK
jgi:hypothetical protein